MLLFMAFLASLGSLPKAKKQGRWIYEFFWPLIGSDLKSVHIDTEYTKYKLLNFWGHIAWTKPPYDTFSVSNQPRCGTVWSHFQLKSSDLYLIKRLMWLTQKDWWGGHQQGHHGPVLCAPIRTTHPELIAVQTALSGPYH